MHGRLMHGDNVNSCLVVSSLPSLGLRDTVNPPFKIVPAGIGNAKGDGLEVGAEH